MVFILLFLSVFSGIAVSLLNIIGMKKICNKSLSNQIVITLLITSTVASFFAMVNSSVPTVAFRLIALLSFISVTALISSKNKFIPDIIIVFAIAVRFIIAVVDFMSFRSQFTPMILRDIFGLVIGIGIVILINKLSHNFFTVNELKLFAVMGMFSGYICTYITIMFAIVSAFLIEKYISNKNTKKIHISFEPLVFCGYIISMILYKS